MTMTKMVYFHAILVVFIIQFMNYGSHAFQLPYKTPQSLNTIQKSIQSNNIDRKYTHPFLQYPHPKYQSKQFKSQANSNNDNITTKKNQPPTKPRPDPSILVSSKDISTQQLIIGVIFTSLFLGTTASTQILSSIGHTIDNLFTFLPSDWFTFYSHYLLAPPLGLIFIIAGITHFTSKQAYTSIVPPQGTWGFWDIPTPGRDILKLSYEDYHTYWTGIAELLGGLGLITSSVVLNNDGLMHLFSSLLGILVVAVSFANIYMFTHDAIMEDENIPLIPYPEGHVFRLVMQCFLLSCFWILTFNT